MHKSPNDTNPSIKYSYNQMIIRQFHNVYNIANTIHIEVTMNHEVTQFTIKDEEYKICKLVSYWK